MSLFSPVPLGDFLLRNRVVMAPMTRARADAQGVPSPLATEYYGSRADAGLILTEGTGPSLAGMGYARTPGIYSPAQIAAWRNVTAAVVIALSPPDRLASLPKDSSATNY